MFVETLFLNLLNDPKVFRTRKDSSLKQLIWKLDEDILNQ